MRNTVRGGRLTPLALLAAALLGGCTIADVTTEPGEDVLVVEAVLRTDRARQEVLLHHTLDGRFAGSEPGARVTVTDSLGNSFTFREGSDCYRIDARYQESDPVDFEGTCYVSDPTLGRWVTPGRAYELRVETQDGRVVRGRTRVPGAFELAGLPDIGGEGTPFGCSILPLTKLPLAWSSSDGAWSYVAQIRIVGLRRALEPQGLQAPDPLELRGLAVSEDDTTLVLPTEFGVFERFSQDQDVLVAIQNGFPDGVLVLLRLAAADRNWVNGVRGGSFNPSGQVRVSSVVGDGVGVFGSLVPRTVIIEARVASPYPRCVPGTP